MLRAHAGHGSATAAAAELGTIAASLQTRIEVGPDGRIRPAAAGQGPPAALARLLLIAAEAGTAGTWVRLKACSADDCQWSFYDLAPHQERLLVQHADLRRAGEVPRLPPPRSGPAVIHSSR